MMIEGLKQAMTAKQDKPRIVGSGLALSTGSTLLNLAMTGDSQRGWVAGHYFLFVGDSDSGKSWFMHTALAEASINPKFDGYRLIYDNTEAKSLMDINRYFGDRLAARITAPRESNGGPVFSETAEDFYYNVDDALKDGRPFIYILDSQDSLTSNREAKKFGQLRPRRGERKARSATGTFQTARPRCTAATCGN